MKRILLYGLLLIIPILYIFRYKDKKKINKINNKNNTNIINITDKNDLINANKKPLWVWKDPTKTYPIEMIIPLRQLNVTYKDDKFYFDNYLMEWIPSDYENIKGYWTVHEGKSSYQINYLKFPNIYKITN